MSSEHLNWINNGRYSVLCLNFEVLLRQWYKRLNNLFVIGEIAVDSYYVDDLYNHESSDGAGDGNVKKLEKAVRQIDELISESDLQGQVTDLKVEVKAISEEIKAIKVRGTKRESYPLYDTVDDDGNIVEEEAEKDDQGVQKGPS